MKKAIFLAFLTLLVGSGQLVSAQGGEASKGSGAAPVNLNGKWKTDAGEEVTIDQLGSGTVVAIFENGDCKDGGHRPKYIDGHLSGYTLKGKMWRCTSSKPLSEDCGLGDVFTTTFQTTLVSNDLIKGTRRTEYYKNAEDGDKAKNVEHPKCKYVRDESGDKDVDFSLSRVGTECPDAKEIEKYEAVADRAAKFTEAAAHFVKDQKISSALDSSQKALRGTANLLSSYVKLGKKCAEIHDSLDEIYQFQAAIDQINNAGCDSQALAGGFDNLFQAAGQIGKRFVKLPELQPLFEILAANHNFFQKVSGALDPEHRWADQFAGIEGYIPNCSQ